METQEQQILDASVPVEPFDIEERVKSIHERRRRLAYSNRDNIRYVLFILDTSGSIGRSQFVRVKYLLALMSEKLCDHLQVAMITYGLDIKLEFCFNCTWTGVEYSMPSHVCPVPRGIHSHHWRHQVCLPMSALQTSIVWTSTCPTPNTDIVYLTDGYHNGPCRSNLANEVNCFHNQPNINTYNLVEAHATF